jgi:dTDP-4-dehydrorhamnose reductase
MRTLILGGTGMLGQAMAREGRRRGHAVLALGRRQADVRDRAALAGAVSGFRPELVVNCAAFTQVDACEEDPETAAAVNAEGAAHAAAAAAAGGARFVQVSTDYVFDGESERPYREEDAPAPLSVYGRTKLAGERAALAHEGALAMRTSWLFGPGGGNFVATIVRLIEEGEPLRVVADQVGCPTFTPYLSRALWDLAALRVSGLLHYRNRDPVSWHGFATAIAGLAAPGVEVEAVPSAAMPRPARRPAYSVLDVGRVEALLGRAVEPWARGLGAYLSGIFDRGSLAQS